MVLGRMFDCENAIEGRSEHFLVPTKEFVSGQDLDLAPIRTRRTMLVLTISLTLVAYIATLRFDFVYDDLVQLVHNPMLHSWRDLPQYFTTHNWSYLRPHSLGNYYRPLMLVWKLLNYKAFGLNPVWWHVTTILLHITATVLVYRFASRVAGDESVASAAALIFGLHPVHLEVVAWASGATDSMLAVLMLTSFLFYLRYREHTGSQRRGRYMMALSLIFYALATLTKEAGISLPGLIICYEWISSSKPGDRQKDAGETSGSKAESHRASLALRRALPFMAVTVAYLLWRVHVLHGLSHATNRLAASTILFTIPSLLCFYLRLLIAPVALSPFYDIPLVTGLSLKGFLLPLAVLAVLALAMWFWARRSPAVGVAVCWLAFPMLAVLNLRVFWPDDLAHDRYLYVPSIGFSLLAGLGLRWLRDKSRARALSIPRMRFIGAAKFDIILPLLIAGVLGAGTALQANMWQSQIVLYARALKLAPGSARARAGLGLCFMSKGLYADAIRTLLPAMEQNPRDEDLAFNLGIAYEKLGDWATSEGFFDRAISANSAESGPFYQKGLIRLRSGDLDEANRCASTAIDLSPNEIGYHYLLGIILEQQRDFPRALTEFKQELANHPEETDASKQIQALQSQVGRLDIARRPQSAPMDRQ
jgi:hypothetical protein